MAIEKTAATVLQELMVKLGQTPEYKCTSQSGPQHMAMFEYQCEALGVIVKAIARSKKEAKQETARLMLLELTARGHKVPPPYGGMGVAAAPPPVVGPAPVSSSALPAMSYVALLKELSEEYKLPAVEYDLVSDTGPPHMRHFTIRARIGMHERQATATTKKAARQQAAEQLYTYLRENLARVTNDFDELDALERSHQKTMDRYIETREELVARPHLGQKIVDYHLGLATNIDEKLRGLAKEALECTRTQPAESVLAVVACALGLVVDYTQLPAAGGALTVAQLAPTSPPLALIGRQRADAADAALRYLRLALLFSPPSQHS